MPYLVRLEFRDNVEKRQSWSETEVWGPGAFGSRSFPKLRGKTPGCTERRREGQARQDRTASRRRAMSDFETGTESLRDSSEEPGRVCGRAEAEASRKKAGKQIEETTKKGKGKRYGQKCPILRKDEKGRIS